MGLFSKYYFLAALVLGGFLSGCGGLSVEEQAARRAQIIADYGGVYNDARLARYGNAALQRVRAGFVDEKTRARIGAPQLFILDSDVVELFAQKYGAIYITRGALALAGDEAQLAAGFGVAMAAQRYSRNYPPQLSGRRARAVDAAGVKAAARAGYHPAAWEKFLRSVAAYQNYKNAHKNGKASPNLLTASERRLRALQSVSAEVIAERGGVGRFVRNQQRYLSAIDGLEFGDGEDIAQKNKENNKRVRGQSFMDTKLGLGFSLPQGFVLEDSGGRVVAQHKNGLEFVFDALPQKTQTDIERTPLEYLRETWLADLGDASALFNVSGQEIGGVAAASARVGGARREANLLVLAHKGNWLRFALFAPPQLAGQAGSVMRSLTRSLDFNLAAARENSAPRLRIILVQSGDSVSRLARRMRVGSPRDSLFKIINSIGDNIRAGASVKIIN